MLLKGGSVASAGLSFENGTSIGGRYLVIDSITWSPTGASTLELNAAHPRTDQDNFTIWKVTAPAAGIYHFDFGKGYTVLGPTEAYTADPNTYGVTITLDGGANGGLATVTYHYERKNN